MDVKPIEKASAATKVFEALYEMIATGRFPRGGKLPPQDQLALQFGVSRNTLREAVHKLSVMGLLVSRQGVGTVVEPPSPGGYLADLGGRFLLDPLSVREFIEARICIERTAVRLAVARAGPEDLKQLAKILERQERAVRQSDSLEFTGHDAAFHLRLAQVSGNRVLQKFLETIQDMLRHFIGEVSELPGAMKDALGFHHRLVQAIAARDPDAAELQMLEHLHDVVQRIESNLKVDLERQSLCGFELLGAKNPKTTARRSRKK